MEHQQPELLRVSEIFSTVVSRLSANSSGDGSRSNSCSNLENALLILLRDPTWFKGKERFWIAQQLPVR